MRDSGKTVTVLNLAVPGSVVGPEIENLARQLGRGSIGNFVERQLPFVSRSSTLVTIFGGANDVNVVGNAIEQGLGGGNPVGWGTAFATGFGRDLATIVDGVRARAPNARIILLNPPNGAGMPYVATARATSCASCRRSRCASPPRPTSRRRAACWSST